MIHVTAIQFFASMLCTAYINLGEIKCFNIVSTLKPVQQYG